MEHIRGTTGKEKHGDLVAEREGMTHSRPLLGAGGRARVFPEGGHSRKIGLGELRWGVQSWGTELAVPVRHEDSSGWRAMWPG